MQSFMLADFSGEKGDFLSFPRFSSISYIKYEAAFHHLQGQNSHFKLALLFFPSFVGAALLLLLGGKKASRNYYCPTSALAEHFTVSEPQNPPSDVFKLHRICQSAVFKCFLSKKFGRVIHACVGLSISPLLPEGEERQPDQTFRNFRD